MGFVGFIFTRNVLLDEWKEASVLKLQRAAHFIDMRLTRPIEVINMFHNTGEYQGDLAIQAWLLDQLRAMDGVSRVDLDAPLSVAEAGDFPSPGSKPLSAILKSVEEQRLGVITKAEFDDGLWEVKICDVGPCQKLYIDPRSGEEKRRRKTDSDELPPANAMVLSTIIQSLEASALWIITEVKFDDGFWEVELGRGRPKDQAGYRSQDWRDKALNRKK